MTLISLAIGFLFSIQSILGAPAVDRVTSLPQMPDLSFGMYSGYLPIKATKRSLHYTATLSKKNNVTDPVIIWFSGGPGCSSMVGMLQELGPYVIDDGETQFKSNKFSWNNEANLFFIETPAGVGFSTCGAKFDAKGNPCGLDDVTQGNDNLQAILTLLTTKFPEYLKNDLYLAGESYGGVYVPYVAKMIDDYNNANRNKPKATLINLKGIMIGNGLTDWKYDTYPATLNYSFNNGLITAGLYNEIRAACGSLEYFATDNFSEACYGKMYQLLGVFDYINMYNVFGKCYSQKANNSSGSVNVSSSLNQIETDYEDKTFYTIYDYAPWLRLNRNNNQNTRKYHHKHNLQQDPVACLYLGIFDSYLNNQTVRTALKIPKTVQNFTECSYDVNANYKFNRSASIFIYPQLKNKYRILHYSGNADAVVPTVGTLQWIASLNWTNVTQPWGPYFVNNEVSGFYETRDNLTIATIHGAGHLTPQQKREQTQSVIFKWIKGLKL